MKFEVKDGKDLEEQKKTLMTQLQNRQEIVRNPEIEVFVSGTESKPDLDTYFWIDSKKTNLEKLKSILSSEINPSGKANVPLEAKSDVQAVLARAAERVPHDPKEKHL